MFIKIQFVISVLFLSLNFFIITFQQCINGVPDFKDDLLILETLNGKVKGSCDQIEIKDPDNLNMNDYVISWKSKHQSSLKFDKHISNVCKTVKKKCARILRALFAQI